MALEFKLPELGENIKSGTVTRVLVTQGAVVQKNQPVLEVETDKAVLEVPSSVAGTVLQIGAKEGSIIKVGDLVFTVDADGAPAAPEKQAPPKPEPAPAAKAAPAPEPPKPPATAAKPASAPIAAAEPEEETSPDVAAPSATPAPQRPDNERRPALGLVPAAPSVRGFAREIGVDITEVTGTGPGARISIQDVKDYARKTNTDIRPLGGGASPVVQSPLPDFSRWGEVDRKPMNNVRRRTAHNLANAWASIPHVTQFDKVDVTELEKLRKQFGKQVEAAGGKLTVTAIIVKVLAYALKKFPQFNCSVDMENFDLVYKHFYNIGIAVDTDRGLLVPVIKNVDKKNLTELSIEITALADRARNRKTTLEEMQGATFTISNLGGIGGTGFTPIINPPEVAILGIARTQVEPIYINSQWEPRQILPLSLSYDHRVVDGADGARFLRWVVQVLEQPFLLFIEG
jgi:pyruvate dehydrogenase E2 component (dihydrolipoamide acetyltransferase)